MKLILIHGRKTPDEELTDWGFVGPVLKDIKYVHGTYLTHIMVGFNSVQAARKAQKITGWESFDQTVLEVQLHDDLIKTRDGFFGDFELVENDDPVGT